MYCMYSEIVTATHYICIFMCIYAYLLTISTTYIDRWRMFAYLIVIACIGRCPIHICILNSTVSMINMIAVSVCIFQSKENNLSPLCMFANFIVKTIHVDCICTCNFIQSTTSSDCCCMYVFIFQK
jgi:hypothetical protein